MIKSNYIFIDSDYLLEKHLSDITSLKFIGLDTETTGLDVFNDKLLLLQIGNLDKQYLIDARNVNIKPLKKWLENDKIIKVVTNGKFDYMFLKHNGIELEGLVDIMLIEKILLNGLIHLKTKGVFSLSGMSKKYLNYDMDKSTRETFVSHKGKYTDQQLKYASLDIIVPILILQKQKPLILKEGLSKIVNIENEAIPAFGDIEYNGIYLDAKQWYSLLDKNKNKLAKKIRNLDKFFEDVTEKNLFGENCYIDGSPINYESKDQLNELLRRKGYSLEDTAHVTLLTQLPSKVSKLIIDYRKISKAISSFGDNYVKFINHTTKRIHPNISQIGAVSGRSAFDNPNLQQVKNEQEYRDCFRIQDDNNIFSDSDYSGQETRIFAFRNREPKWIELINEDKNLHEYVGSILFNTTVSKKENQALYKITKNLNFGIAYLCGAYKVMMFYKEAGLECDIDTATNVLNLYGEKFPLAVRSAKQTAVDGVLNGYVSSIYGRKRYFDDIPPFNLRYTKTGLPYIVAVNRDDKDAVKKLGNIQRFSANGAIQSSGADMLKVALIKLRKSLKEIDLPLRTILVVHDEIIDEIPKEESEVYIYLKEKAMLEAEEEMLPGIKAGIESTITTKWEK